jgi:serine/threonine protein phosphatase 1
LIWDRELVGAAWEAFQAGTPWHIPGYEEVFVGHTPTLLFGSEKPLQLGNLWLMDTGAGHQRMLTIMDVATKDFWQERATE